ncbi:Hypothetical protein PHPALM_8487 [Phytophthora palmivora]|uniref:Uncharacterized protein n=1 Tax=Phytophthora palmivora TaxID=4796 RepID=A0A2P4Y9Q2_9STRA|nr:Hypothetical protein PHPALM_8487 [Phytophthora palmivora]
MGFVVKYTGTGDIDRFNASLVVKVFLQELGIDFDEIFSPVIGIQTAFLNGLLEEEIYMVQPEGFKVPGKEHQYKNSLCDGVTCYIDVNAEDLLIIATTPAIIKELKSALKKRFFISDLGEMKFLLGWSIQRDRKNRTLFIHQHK